MVGQCLGFSWIVCYSKKLQLLQPGTACKSLPYKLPVCVCCFIDMLPLLLLLQSALSSRSSSTRTRVWTLVNNISITDSGHLQCSWPDGNITYPMQLLGQVVHTFNMSSHVHGVPDRRSTEGIVLGQAMANEGASTHAQQDGFDVYGAPLSPPLSELYSLSFGYMPDLFQLPADAQDKFLQIQNITLAQLPQAARSQAAVRGVGRRLLQQQQQRMPPGQDSSPVGIWTILLWPIKRCVYACV